MAKVSARSGRAMRAVALGAAAIGWASLSLASERIYKSVDADGVVTYSQTPIPGAKETMAIDIETLSPEQRRAALILRSRLEKNDRALEESLAKLDEQWRGADQEIREAGEALLRAEAALGAGRARRTGDTIGRVGGGARLTGAYFERLAALEKKVKTAKSRLDRAYEARNTIA